MHIPSRHEHVARFACLNLKKVSTAGNRRVLALKTIKDLEMHDKKMAVAVWEEMRAQFPDDIGDSDSPY